MELYFQYDAPNKGILGADETGGGFAALLEFDESLAKEWGVWVSFVAEYRSHFEALEEASGEEADGMSDEPPDEEEMEALLDGYDSWGPSLPFEPDEAKEWANRWIMILDSLSDEKARAIFPLADWLHHKDSTYGRNDEINDLRKLIAQCECAARHQVKMTLMMVMG